MLSETRPVCETSLPAFDNDTFASGRARTKNFCRTRCSTPINTAIDWSCCVETCHQPCIRVPDLQRWESITTRPPERSAHPQLCTVFTLATSLIPVTCCKVLVRFSLSLIVYCSLHRALQDNIHCILFYTDLVIPIFCSLLFFTLPLHSLGRLVVPETRNIYFTV